MAWPVSTISTTNLDQSTDSPASARADLLQAVQSVNQIIQALGTAGGPAQLDAAGKLLPSQVPDNVIPAGSMFDFAGSTAPTGYLLCYGQAVSRTTYATLFNAIGTVHGAGDGSTTFNLPDARGRTRAGKDNMGGSTAGRITTGGSGIDGTVLGAAGGAETHTLTTPQIPSHTHTNSGNRSSTAGGAATIDVWQQIGGTIVAQTNTTNATGGGGAHNNTQPTLIVNVIIKT